MKIFVDSCCKFQKASACDCRVGFSLLRRLGVCDVRRKNAFRWSLPLEKAFLFRGKGYGVLSKSQHLESSPKIRQVHWINTLLETSYSSALEMEFLDTPRTKPVSFGLHFGLRFPRFSISKTFCFRPQSTAGFPG